MLPELDLDTDLLCRLPLPLAQLYHQAGTAPTPAKRHEAALHLWEALLKLLGAVCLVSYAPADQHDSNAAEWLPSLCRPSLNRWWEMVRHFLPRLADAGRPEWVALRDRLLVTPCTDLPQVARLDADLRATWSHDRDEKPSASLAGVVSRLIRYREHLFGDRTTAPSAEGRIESVGASLFRGAAEMLAKVDLLGGRQLVQLHRVDETKDGCQVDRLLLVGERARPIAPLWIPRHATGRLLSLNRIYLQDPAADNGLIDLHPFLVYDGGTAECLFLTGCSDHKIEYRCYATGSIVERPDSWIADELAILRNPAKRALPSSAESPAAPHHPPDRTELPFAAYLRMEQCGNVVVATLNVESLDANNARDFKEWTAPLLEPNARVVLDLGRVQFIDSAGCGAILGFYRRLNSNAGQLIMCSLPRPMRSMVEMAHMHQVFDIVQNRDEALRAFGHTPVSALLVPSSESPAPFPLRQLDENVQFTVYRPRAVEPGKWYPLLAFAHLDELPADAPADARDPVAEVKRQAEQVLGNRAAAYQPTTQDSRVAVPREGEITFVPNVPGVQFNPPRRSFLWLENVHREEFQLRAGKERDGQTAKGTLTVFLGSIILAEITLSIRVRSGLAAPADTQPVEPSSARPYRKIFASYSHADLTIVHEFERFAQLLGDTYLRDWTHLRAGEVWNDRLLQMIEEADVFQLFWSWNALRSDYVRREWSHALSLNRPNFIRPTYWEDPLPQLPEEGLPPPDLLRLHFQRLPRDEAPPAPATPEETSTHPTTSGKRQGPVPAMLEPTTAPPAQTAAIPQSPPPIAGRNRLVVIAGPDKSRRFELPAAGVFTMGRGSNSDTRLNDLRVSRGHCRVEVAGSVVKVSDLGSATGTFVNDEPISGWRHLRFGDVIRIGDTEILYEQTDVEQQPTVIGSVRPVPMPSVAPSRPPVARRSDDTPSPSARPRASEAPRSAAPEEPPVRARCESCGQMVLARKHLAGTLVRCPSCGKQIPVPGEPPTGERMPPASVGSPNPRSEDSIRSMPARRVPARLIGVLVAVAIIIGLLYLIVGRKETATRKDPATLPTPSEHHRDRPGLPDPDVP